MSLKLYQQTEITKQLEYLVDNADELTPEEQEAVLKTIDELGVATEQKVEGITHVLNRMETDEQILADEIKRLQARKKSIQGERERLKQYLIYNMQQANIKTIKTARVTVTLKNCPASIVETEDFDISKVENRFVKVKTTESLDKKAVLDDYKMQIKQAPDVPPVLPDGIEVVEDKQTVQIK